MRRKPCAIAVIKSQEPDAEMAFSHSDSEDQDLDSDSDALGISTGTYRGGYAASGYA
jgi:hypothetical protein